jgi:hypothetical protein
MSKINTRFGAILLALAALVGTAVVSATPAQAAACITRGSYFGSIRYTTFKECYWVNPNNTVHISSLTITTTYAANGAPSYGFNYDAQFYDNVGNFRSFTGYTPSNTKTFTEPFGNLSLYRGYNPLSYVDTFGYGAAASYLFSYGY